MPVNVIGTLKPKNNGKFPVAEAVDIKVTDDLRLDKALENKADLATVNFALDNKADKTTTTSLQSQIDEIITPVTQDAEVQNARVGADGTSYVSLKSRLDTEEANTKAEIVEKTIIPTSFTWNYGTIHYSGEVRQSEWSKYTNPFILEANQTITITTKKNKDCVIASTDADSVAVGDYVTPIINAAANSDVKTYSYTASSNIKLVVCILYNDNINDVIVSNNAAYGMPVSVDMAIAKNKISQNTNDISGLSSDVGYIEQAFLVTPTGAEVGAKLTTGGAAYPNNRLHFYGGESDSTLHVYTDTIINISARNNNRVSFVLATDDGRSLDSGWLTLPQRYVPVANGDLKVVFARESDSLSFDSISDMDGTIKFNSPQIESDVEQNTTNISGLTTEVAKIDTVLFTYPTGEEVGAKLAQGGAPYPNNRIHFYGNTSDSTLSVSTSTSIFISARNNNRVDFVLEADDGRVVDSGWLTLPRAYTPIANGTLRVSFARERDSLTFESISDMDGTIKLYNPYYASDKNGPSELEHTINNARHPYFVGKTTLLHFSDIHADANALKRIMKKYDELIDNDIEIADCICTGDLVPDHSETIESWWDERVLTCIGNHDSAVRVSGGYNWVGLSMADRDAYYIAPFESNWNIEHTSGTSYYYKDYSNNYLRLIVIDLMLYNDDDPTEATAQKNWLSSTIDSAKALGYHVVIAAHAPHGGSTPVVSSFSKYGEVEYPTYTDCDLPSDIINLVADKIQNGLHFVGYLVGHTHQDNIWDCTGDGTQLAYCITCANVSQTTQWSHSDQHRSSTEDAFNVITIVTGSNLIKIIRGGGANIDSMMRDRKYICINYATGTVISE